VDRWQCYGLDLTPAFNALSARLSVNPDNTMGQATTARIDATIPLLNS
jgi:hypothetical protein